MAHSTDTPYSSGESERTDLTRPTTRGPDRVLWRSTAVLLGALVFLVEAVVVLALYWTSSMNGYSFTLAPSGSTETALGLGAVLGSFGLAIYLLAVAERRLQARLVARLDAAGTSATPYRKSAENPMWRRTALNDGVLASSSVLFFAESACLSISLLVGPITGSPYVFTTNSIGEFPVEFGLVVLALGMASILLFETAAPVTARLHERYLIRHSLLDARGQRWLRSVAGRPIPLRAFAFLPTPSAPVFPASRLSVRMRPARASPSAS